MFRLKWVNDTSAIVIFRSPKYPPFFPSALCCLLLCFSSILPLLFSIQAPCRVNLTIAMFAVDALARFGNGKYRMRTISEASDETLGVTRRTLARKTEEKIISSLLSPPSSLLPPQPSSISSLLHLSSPFPLLPSPTYPTQINQFSLTPHHSARPYQTTTTVARRLIANALNMSLKPAPSSEPDNFDQIREAKRRVWEDDDV